MFWRKKKPIEERHAFCTRCGAPMMWQRHEGNYNQKSGKRQVWDRWECRNYDQGLHDPYVSYGVYEFGGIARDYYRNYRYE
jgi:hypothetical protein